MKKLIALLLAAVLALALVACGGGNTTTPPSGGENTTTTTPEPEETTEPEMSEEEKLAYSCAIDLVEAIMDNATNPHSLEIYTIKYHYGIPAGEYAVPMEDEIYEIYIEYGLQNSMGGNQEFDGVAWYDDTSGEWNKSDKLNESIRLAKRRASRTNMAVNILGLLDDNSLTDKDEVSDWNKLDIDKVKSEVGLS